MGIVRQHRKILVLALGFCMALGLFSEAAAEDGVYITFDVYTEKADQAETVPSEFTLIGDKWMRQTGKNFLYNGSSVTEGLALEYVFTGTSVALIGYTDKNVGNIDVFLDSQPAPGTDNGKVVIQRTDVPAANQILYQAEGLVLQSHTLRVTIRSDYPSGQNYFELQKIRYAGLKSIRNELEELAGAIGWNEIRGQNISRQRVWTDLNLTAVTTELQNKGVNLVWNSFPQGYIDNTSGRLLMRPAEEDIKIRLSGTLSKGTEVNDVHLNFTLVAGGDIFISPESGFYSTDGKQTAMASEGEKFQFCTCLENQTGEIKQAEIITAVYDFSGSLLRCRTTPVQLSGYQKMELTVPMAPLQKNETASVFCWESESIMPIHKPFRIQNNNLNIYVSPLGDDRGDGSFAYPFQSVARATLAAQNASASMPEADVTIFFREGVYYMNEPVEWDAENTPSEAGSITYSAYGDEKVEFNGSVYLEQLQWERYSGDIMVSDIGPGYDFDVLYANSARQTMARYPNYTTDDTLFGYHGAAADVLAAERIKNVWKSVPEEGYVRAMHEREWGGNSYKITDVDNSGNASLAWVGDNNRGAAYNPAQMVVENIFEELDAENEWFYDKKTGKLYYCPPKGMELSGAAFEGAAASELIRLSGNSAEKAVQNITFDGICFTKTHRTLFNSSYERPLRGDWGLARTGVIFMENAKNITIKNCEFNEIGGNAVMMSGYNENHTIDQNAMTHIGASAVLIVGKEDAVRDPSHWDDNDHKAVISDKERGPKTEDYPRDITVSNNYMYDLGLYEKQVSGVCMSIASRIHVKGNTIHRCPRAGVNISDGTFGGHLIEDNDIFDCVRGTGDHGPVNAWGRDRFWSLGGYNTRGSDGAKKKPYAFLDAMETSIIRHNRITHTGEFGVDLDDGSSNYEIYDNLFLGTGIKLREGFSRTVRNNIIINSKINIHVSYAGNDDYVQNNIIISNMPYKFISTNEGSKTTFEKNLFYFGINTVTVNSEGNSADVDYTIADPLFAAPASQDYTVKALSPALELGFKNFDMNSFGVKGAPEPPVQKLNFEIVDDGSDEENFMGGRISSIYSEGILSAAGMKEYKGLYIIAPLDVRYSGSDKLQENDVILSMNGQEIQNKQDFLEKYEKLPEEAVVSVMVFRDQMQYERAIVWKK